VESCSLLILTVKEDNAFICELPVFQQVKFKQWDPGGECSLVYVEGPLDYENNMESCCYQFTPLLYSNLEDKVDFNGGSNVMIQYSI
jgi:hypothetical protein